ncbi:MAG: sigma-70 family RNA polymerase sigma factor [Planctomycetes bacterium]|nr:sigma-70 family RNA polymerase sigma factor [Planctomycetota bacterium]
MDYDLALLQRYASKRDAEAFAELARRNSSLVYGTALRILGNADDALEVSQECFYKLALQAESVTSSVPGWLHRAARNLALNERAAIRTRKRHESAAPRIEGEPDPRWRQVAPHVDEDLELLHKDLRETLILHFLQGVRQEEIAARLGVEQSTVSRRIEKGIVELRSILEKTTSDLPTPALAAFLTAQASLPTPAALLAAQGKVALGALSTVQAQALVKTTASKTAAPHPSASFWGGTPMKIAACALVCVTAATAAITLAPKGGTEEKPAAGPNTVPPAAPKGDPKSNPKALLGSYDFTPSRERPVGWRGDGTGRFPGATPPVSWERKRDGNGYAAKGILWMTPLPNKAISSPVVVGLRIFVTCEFADLVCVDKASGKILWIRSNLEFEALSEDERKAYPTIAEKLEPLGLQLSALNNEAVGALNALQGAAVASEYREPPVLTKKRALEKQIREQQQAIDKKLFASDWPQNIYGFCTETPASDGKYLGAFFATGVAACYDFDGNRQWIAKGTNGGEEKGHYASPIMAGGQFVVWGDPEMRGYDVVSGKVLWRVPSKGSNCGSLIRFQAGGELVAGVQTTCFARIRDGKPIWTGRALEYSFTSPIVDGDTVYFWSAGFNKELKAYKVPASTDSGQLSAKLTFKKPDWAANDLAGKYEKGDLNASPLYDGGLLYNLYCGGGLTAHDTTTGDLVYRKVLPMKPRTEYWAWGGASASPALAGKYIYLMDNQGTTVVVEPGRQYKEVTVNRIEESFAGSKEQVQNLASPWFEGGRMYFRSPQYLYCIGEK